MITSQLAAHARKTVWGGALLSLLATMGVAVVLMVSSQWQSIAVGQQAAINQVQAIRREVTDTLLLLNKKFQPDCSAANLRTLRELVFQARYIGDVGVFDTQTRLICTTTTGLLAAPLAVPPPDVTGKFSNGQSVHVNYNASLLVAQPEVRTTITRVGRFNAVVFPFSMTDILDAGAAAVQLRTSDNRVMTAVQREDLPDGWKERLRSRDYTGTDFQEFQWNEASFVAVRRVPGSFYVVQSVVPLRAFLKIYSGMLIGAAGLACLIGALVFQALRPVVLRWQSLEHRIEHLLIPANIVCMYQPIVELATGKVCGCEVLMRVRDGQTIIAPDEAIPAIVARQLTWQLDQMVVGKAVQELAQALPWLSDFKVAFNFFPDNVQRAKLRRLFQQVLQATPHGGLRFDLEVIEQQYQDSIVGEIVELRKDGFLVSVDDFGTGYSNLGSIKAISPDFLKIDRSFVHDMQNASLRASLIPEIVGIARAVGASVIAEGIEHEAEVRLLQGMGVEFGQGYFFARPQAMAMFAEYLQASQAAGARHAAHSAEPVSPTSLDTGPVASPATS